MIVISGALVLVAAVLLVLGIVSSITLVYAAIGLSLVSAVFLLVGVFQRPVPAGGRGSSLEDDPTRAPPPVRISKPPKAESKTAAAVEVREPELAAAAHTDDEFGELADVDAAADYPLEAANAEFERRAEATGADVLVISGRPRYHLGGCEYVDGHEEAEPLDIVEARELGFTPCGVCRPNESLGRSASGRRDADTQAAPVTVAAPVEPAAPAASAASVAAPATTALVTAPAAVSAAAAHSNGSRAGSNGLRSAPVVAEPQPVSAVTAPPVAEPLVAEPPAMVEPEPEPEPAAAAEPVKPRAVKAPRKRVPRAKKPVEAAAQEASVTSPPVAEAAVEVPSVEVPSAEASAVTEAPAAEVPAEAAPAAPVASSAAPAKAAARPRVATRSVLAVAVTKEYHRSGCVLLEGVDADELTKAAAIRQGFLACGVCKP